MSTRRSLTGESKTTQCLVVLVVLVVLVMLMFGDVADADADADAYAYAYAYGYAYAYAYAISNRLVMMLWDSLGSILKRPFGYFLLVWHSVAAILMVVAITFRFMTVSATQKEMRWKSIAWESIL